MDSNLKTGATKKSPSNRKGVKKNSKQMDHTLQKTDYNFEPVGLVNPYVFNTYVQDFPDLVKDSKKSLIRHSSSKVTTVSCGKKKESCQGDDGKKQKPLQKNIGKKRDSLDQNNDSKGYGQNEMKTSQNYPKRLENKKHSHSQEHDLCYSDLTGIATASVLKQNAKKSSERKELNRFLTDLEEVQTTSMGRRKSRTDSEQSKVDEFLNDLARLQSSSTKEQQQKNRRSSLNEMLRDFQRIQANSNKYLISSPDLAEDNDNLLKLNEVDHNSRRTQTSQRNEENYVKRNSRSTQKYKDFSRDIKPKKDFSIDLIDWYHLDPNYYRNKLDIILRDFSFSKSCMLEERLSYNYLLLDPRKHPNVCWQNFIDAIFYIGRGQNNRANDHMKYAEKAFIKNVPVSDKKISTILQIWETGHSILVLKVFKNILRDEASTREAFMIDAIGLKRLTNKISGSYYGVASTMSAREKCEMGAVLLVEVQQILTINGAEHVHPKLDSLLNGQILKHRSVNWA